MKERQDDPIRRILGGGGDWHDRVLESNEGHADKARRTDRLGVWELGVAISRPGGRRIVRWRGHVRLAGEISTAGVIKRLSGKRRMPRKSQRP